MKTKIVIYFALLGLIQGVKANNQNDLCSVDSIIVWLENDCDNNAELSEVRNDCIFYILQTGLCDDLLQRITQCNQKIRDIFLTELRDPNSDEFILHYDLLLNNIRHSHIAYSYKKKCKKAISDAYVKLNGK